LVGGQLVSPIKSARNLGVLLDAELTMDVQASAVVKGCFYQLRQLRSVRRPLTVDARCAVVTAFVADRLDYCNAVLYGAAITTIQRLQTVINAAARLVGGLGKYDHVTPVLRDTLHCRLPIQQRIEFKVAVLAFDCVRGTVPALCSSAAFSPQLKLMEE